ncbi:MAG: hypothetical protein M3N38_07295 [Pseudomonadota bacterium]|nr:hypothetical protein [Pseudomonadota bacterium]
MTVSSLAVAIGLLAMITGRTIDTGPAKGVAEESRGPEAQLVAGAGRTDRFGAASLRPESKADRRRQITAMFREPAPATDDTHPAESPFASDETLLGAAQQLAPWLRDGATVWLLPAPISLTATGESGAVRSGTTR